MAENRYVDCNAVIDLDGTSKLAVGGWFSPSALIDRVSVIGKEGLFILELAGTAGDISFGAHVGDSWKYLTSQADMISENGPGFIVGGAK